MVDVIFRGFSCGEETDGFGSDEVGLIFAAQALDTQLFDNPITYGTQQRFIARASREDVDTGDGPFRFIPPITFAARDLQDTDILELIVLMVEIDGRTDTSVQVAALEHRIDTQISRSLGIGEHFGGVLREAPSGRIRGGYDELFTSEILDGSDVLALDIFHVHQSNPLAGAIPSDSPLYDGPFSPTLQLARLQNRFGLDRVVEQEPVTRGEIVERRVFRSSEEDSTYSFRVGFVPS